MPAILTREMGVRNLGDFINTIKADGKLFIGLGKRVDAWAGSPDQIQNIPEEKTVFWDDLIGIKKIAIKDVIPMAPERRWESGLSYVVFDESKEQAFDDEFYVMNQFYQVFTVTTAGGGTSTVEPLKAEADTVLADGYQWEYMFTVNRYEYQQTPAGWMSVNYGTSIDLSDTAQNMDAYIKLGAKYLLIKLPVLDPLVSSEFTAGQFRQIGILSHPRLLSDESLVINTYEDVADLLPYSGFLIYLENRDPEDIVDGQNSDIKIILRF